MVRSKHRFISIAIIPLKKDKLARNMTVKSADIYTAVFSKVKKMHGDFGFASIKTGLICKYCNEMTGVAILKVRRGSHRFVSTVLPFISEIGKETVQLHTIRTSSTLHKAYKHLKIYQEKQFEKIWNSLDKSELEEMKEKFKNLEEIEKLLVSEQRSSLKVDL